MIDLQHEIHQAFNSRDAIATQNRLLALLIQLLDERMPSEAEDIDIEVRGKNVHL